MDDVAPDLSAADARRAATFVRAHTVLRALPTVPEIALHVADDTLAVWEATQAEVDRGDIDPPFWAFAWAGGLGLARVLLDRPDLVAGRGVVDVATGSGLVAIAAAVAGAGQVTAVDLDPLAVAAARLNATANRVRLAYRVVDVAALDPPPGTVVTAGDVFYERSMTYTMLRSFDRFLAAGCEVLIGDPLRTYLPAERLEPIATVEVDVDAELEDAPVKATLVGRLLPR